MSVPRALRIGILKCDQWSGNLAKRYGDIDVQYKQFFDRSGSKVETTTFDCISGKLPTDKKTLDSFDGFVITGSKYSVYEPLPWIQNLLQLIRNFDQDRRKLFGVCFGHQAVAQALGGKVEKIRWNLSHEVLKTQESFQKQQNFPKKELSVLCIHRDHVTKVPPNFQVWSTNDRCTVQGLIKDDLTFTIQSHPEFRSEVLRELLETKRDIIEPALIQDAFKTIEKPTDSDFLAKWVVEFFKRKPTSPGNNPRPKL